MKCIVIDDEPLAREAMRRLIEKAPQLILMAEFSSGESASAYLECNTVDLVLLDIRMPGIDGISFARSIGSQTLVIFTTAYSQYAIDSYDIDALDYLLKPIKFQRFERAIAKAFSYRGLLDGGQAAIGEISAEYCFIRADKKVLKVAFNDILFIEGLKDYVILHTAKEKIITAMNIKTIQSQLPKDRFIRTSKSFLVNKLNIGGFDNNTIYIGLHEIPIGNAYRADFFEFANKNLLSR